MPRFSPSDHRRKVARPIQFDLFGEVINEPVKCDPPSGVVPLSFESSRVRMIILKGEPWWVLSDVARVLGFKDATHAGRGLKDKHKGLHRLETLGGEQEMVIINEAGLYRLMMRSDKPEAERFQDWITEDVLPTIRKTGTYSVQGGEGRIAKMAKRLRCDRPTAEKRVNVLDLNKEARAQMLTQGGTVNTIIDWHNAGYRGQFGVDTPTLRASLQLKSHQTPLDRMGYLPLAQNSHAKSLAMKMIEESEVPIPAKERPALLEQIAREIAENDLAKLGPTFQFGINEVGSRGRVLDVIKVTLSPTA